VQDLVFDWERYWLELGDEPSEIKEGFLQDPASDFAYISSPTTPVTYNDISGHTCLFLLGEAGVGKTTTIKQITHGLEQRGKSVLLQDLADISSTQDLELFVFGAPEFEKWKTGDHTLHLFLDSLDECVLTFDTVVAALCNMLGRMEPHLERLTLRVACRTGYWQYDQKPKEKFASLFSGGDIKSYELAPIREDDAREAANRCGFSPDAFLDEIRDKRLVPLARIPVTFRLITKLYDEEGALPPTRPEVYEKGCLALCREETASRQFRHGVAGSQRLAVAKRIAALSVFSGCTAISVEADQNDIEDNDLAISEVIGGVESIGARRVDVDEKAVVETLKDTGLFTGGSQERLVWTHRSFAEFLAAQYLKDRGATVPQITGLLIHPDDSESRITPQLRGVAGWMVTLQPDIFDYLVNVDPDVLLEGDLFVLTDEQRAHLVDKLLNLHREGAVSYAPFKTRQRYRQLQHASLSSQLKSILDNEAEPWIVQRVALDILGECDTGTLCDTLADIALDETRAEGVRIKAIRLLSSDCDKQTKMLLKPLIQGEEESDSETRIQSYVLSALWPSLLGSGDVFKSLSAAEDGSKDGLDAMTSPLRHFLRDEFLPELSEDDLTTGLRWIQQQEPHSELGYSRSKFIDELLIRAFRHGGDRLLRRMAETLLALYDRGDRFISVDSIRQKFDSVIEENPDRRRSLIKHVIQTLDARDAETVSRLSFDIYFRAKKAKEEDITWALERLKYARADRSKSNWAELVARLFPPRSVDALSRVIEAYRDSPELQEVLKTYLQPVELQSEEAAELRERHRKRQELRGSQKKSKTPLTPPRYVRIKENLERMEAGELEAWINLYLDTTIKTGIEQYYPLQIVLVDNPGWKEANELTKRGILEAAQRYILEYEPDVPTNWVKTGKYPYDMLAGYAAIRLLHDQNPSILKDLTADIWRRWVSVCVNSPTSNVSEHVEAEKEILRLANRCIPADTAAIWHKLIKRDNKRDGQLWRSDKLDACWSKELAQVIKELLTGEALSPSMVGELLGQLLRHGDSETIDLTKDLIPSRQPQKKQDWETSIEAAIQFLKHNPVEAWDIVWPLLKRRERWGNELLRRAAHQERGFDTSDLDEQKLGKLFLLLSKRYPQSEDPRREPGESYSVTPRDSLMRFRDGLLRQLVERGTWTACKELERIQDILPSLNLNRQINNAKEQARQSTWHPFSPEDILRLLERNENRLVRDGAQLLGVIQESIERLQKRLHGKVSAKVPAAADLWNEVKRNQALHISDAALMEARSKEKTVASKEIQLLTGPGNNPVYYIPKDEERLSDYVQRHLMQDIEESGIVINREVQVKRGQETDLYVDAQIAETGERSAVVVEVKGCWNSKVDQNIETQLKDRYLNQAHAKHGLYLVGWFLCSEWHPSDYRKGQTRNMNLEEAQRHFEQKASAITDNKVEIRALVLDVTWQEE
jgi:hypothetical protein